MRINLPCWIFLVVLTSWTGVNAQDLKAIPPPTVPLVAAVPENADWTITVQNPVEAPKPPPAPGAPVIADRRITVVHSTKTGKFKRDLITYFTGTTDEHWFIDSLYLWTPPNGEVSAFDLSHTPPPAPGTSPDVSPSVSSGFPGVAWLQLDNYDKVVMYENAPSYHYRYASGGIEAWIDVKTQLPLAYKDGDTLYKFKFNPAPDSPLTLPTAYQKAWDTCQLILKSRK